MDTKKTKVQDNLDKIEAIKKQKAAQREQFSNKRPTKSNKRGNQIFNRGRTVG